MSRTFRRTKKIPQWARTAFSARGMWDYHRDRGIGWSTPWSASLKEEANSKRRSHAKQELSKFLKNPDYPVRLHRLYGNPWNWD